MNLGWPEILLILVIVLIVFGVGKLPQVASQLGKGIREFRKGARGDFDEEGRPTKPGKESAEEIAPNSTK
jgi:sec-independent protein translocase protein TatA